MGLSPFKHWNEEGHWVNCSGDKNATPILPNPNPDNYTIKSSQRVNGYTVLVVNYPDCTNYEGNKVLLFRGDPPTAAVN